MQESPDKIRVITLEGPTAVGKTELAASLAIHLGTSVISADARQCYREMEIGVARPEEEILAACPHHFIADRSIEKAWTAGDFETEALALIETLSQTHKEVVLAGGSNLYISALLEGLDSFPEVDEGSRARVAKLEAAHGLRGLQEALQEVDPDYFKLVDVENPRRLTRALEVSWSSGKPYSSFRRQQSLKRPFQVQRIILERSRESLYERINLRVELMLEAGLEEEARKLYPQRGLSTLDTVGYRELFGYFDGLYDREEALRLIKRNSRHYAKRQLTWLRSVQDAIRIDLDKEPHPLDLILSKLAG